MSKRSWRWLKTTMSRLDDLIDLVQTNNDTYLIHPVRNGRAAYIQTDDVCELTIKSWLQIDSRRRQEACFGRLHGLGIAMTKAKKSKVLEYCSDEIDDPALVAALGIAGVAETAAVHEAIREFAPIAWLAEKDGGRFKSFHDILGDLRERLPEHENQALHQILENIAERRANRNHFFHDQEQVGLTVDEKHCLLAFCDLYTLLEQLFGEEFRRKVQANAIVRAQIAVVRLRLAAYDGRLVYTVYQEQLRDSGALQVSDVDVGYEVHSIYRDPVTFMARIRDHYLSVLYERQAEIDRIDALRRPKAHHRRDRERFSAEINQLRWVVDNYLGGMP